MGVASNKIRLMWFPSGCKIRNDGSLIDFEVFKTIVIGCMVMIGVTLQLSIELSALLLSTLLYENTHRD